MLLSFRGGFLIILAECYRPHFMSKGTEAWGYLIMVHNHAVWGGRKTGEARSLGSNPEHFAQLQGCSGDMSLFQHSVAQQITHPQLLYVRQCSGHLG